MSVTASTEFRRSDPASESPHAAPQWTRAFPLDSVPIGRARVLKSAGKQLAIFRPEVAAVYAIDNRCPHEGYPLAQGHQSGNLLLCAWHNFAFDLRSGRCLAGDEAVRSYPARVVDGHIEVDLADPDPSAALPALFESLDEGLLYDRMGQVARDVLRLLAAGVSGEELVLHAAAFDAERAEYGSSHALPVATDVLRMLPRFPGFEAVRPLMQLMSAASDENVRREARPTPEAVDPGDDREAAGERLAELVEGFRMAEAEALLRGALAAGWERERIEGWLYRLCSEHFLGFGHALIYQVKVFDLFDRVGWQHAGRLLPAFLYSIASSTREETIPTHSALRASLARMDEQLPRWYQAWGTAELSESQRSGLLREILDGRLADALDAVASALDAGVAPDALGRAMVIAASERLLRFDVAIDADPTTQEGWLDITHTLTFANATRVALARYRDPRTLRFLFFAAQFVHRMGPLDLPAASRLVLRDRGACSAEQADRERESLEGVVAAVRARLPNEAVLRGSSYLAAGGDAGALHCALEDVILADHGSEPIFIDHYIKTLTAAWDEYETLKGDPLRDLPLLAATRFMASPIRERGLANLTEDALRFVVEGKTPRRRTL
jgi:nitrite reductase/ring-hydroxylating ferredoxin subunit